VEQAAGIARFSRRNELVGESRSVVVDRDRVARLASATVLHWLERPNDLVLCRRGGCISSPENSRQLVFSQPKVRVHGPYCSRFRGFPPKK
jgi:hypothetical protein